MLKHKLIWPMFSKLEKRAVTLRGENTKIMNDKMPYINRDEQFNKEDGLFTWYDEIINIYEAAFWGHYRILNNQ